MNLWDFRLLGKNYLLRRTVSYLVSSFLGNRTITIRRGPLKDLKWRCSKTHQFWMPLGLYEPQTATWLCEHINPNMTFVDIGANAGYFTLLGSKSVGISGKVVAFEPQPIQCETITLNLKANHIRNVRLESLIVSDSTGEMEFIIERNNANSHISGIGFLHAQSDKFRVIKANSITLDQYCEENKIIPDIVKIDVEGAEVSVLRGMSQILSDKLPKIILSIHNEECYSTCIAILEGYNYKVESLPDFEHELCCYPPKASAE